jgi:site-specific DNA recombinase
MENQNPEARKVGIYVRVSTEEQATSGVSIGAQLEKCRQYCVLHEWKVVKEYLEEGKSGYYLEREKIQELIQECRDGLINVVLVYKLDRLSRNLRDILFLVDEEFKKKQVDFVSISESFDTTSHAGRFFFHIIGALAEFERNMIRDRVIMGMDKKANDGYVQYRAPRGYKYLDGKIVVDDEEAAKVRRIFADYIKHRSMAKVAQIHGMSDAKTVQHILSNETYLGYVKWEGALIKGVHDAIIDDDTFNKVEKIRMKMRKQNRKNGSKRPVIDQQGN